MPLKKKGVGRPRKPGTGTKIGVGRRNMKKRVKKGVA